MERDEVLKKLNALATRTSDKPLRRSEARASRQFFLERARITAINILRILEMRGMSQKDLANLLSVTPQTVNLWVKGTENMTFETLGRIEEALSLEVFTLTRPIEPQSAELADVMLSESPTI